MPNNGPEQPGQDNEQEGSLWMNIGKVVLLVIVLTGAWFILDRLIGK